MLAIAKTDPLSTFQTGCFGTGAAPMPLVSTHISVALQGGLAMTSFRRVFRNVEDKSIEATMTFPVPIAAVLTGLVARIGDRRLSAIAQPRQEARATYEEAIDAGKTAVLHEEALKGVHVLTVGHVPPGSEIEVESRWVQPLSFGGEAPTLTIPVTTGDIYGRSPLPETDDILLGDVVHKATIEVSSAPATAHLRGVPLSSGRAEVRLDAAIDLVFTGWVPSPAHGAVSGKTFAITIDRIPLADRDVDAIVLADRSGSMNESGQSEAETLSKFERMKSGLADVAKTLGSNESLELWQFENHFQRLGRATGATGAAALVDKLEGPRGGTEIGAALAEIISRNPEGDILLITDGRGHALDVPALAKGRHRITLVLIGADALEANVGHLATLAGGQIFVASEGDVGAMVKAALDSMRQPYARPHMQAELPASFEFDRSGARIRVAMSEGHLETDDVGRYAVGLGLCLLAPEQGTPLAVEAGIVSHLTSLVLVDEDGAVEEGLPAMRKVPLSRPAHQPLGAKGIFRSAMSQSFALVDSAGPLGMFGSLHDRHAPGPRPHFATFDDIFIPPMGQVLVPPPPAEMDMTWLLEIDWATNPDAWIAGDVGAQPHWMRDLVERLQADHEIEALAMSRGLDKTRLAIAVVAACANTRHSLRVLRAIAPALDPAQLVEIGARFSLGLAPA